MAAQGFIRRACSSLMRKRPHTLLSRSKPFLLASGLLYTFQDNVEKISLEKPINFPNPDRLSYHFLIRQACVGSTESAFTIVTLANSALEESIKSLTHVTSELITLYEGTATSGLDLTDEGYERVLMLESKVRHHLKEIADLELFFHYAKKLLESSSEVAFASGAESLSIQASERLNSVSNNVEKSIGNVKLLQLDLAKIQSKFIENLKIEADEEGPADNDREEIKTESPEPN